LSGLGAAILGALGLGGRGAHTGNYYAQVFVAEFYFTNRADGQGSQLLFGQAVAVLFVFPGANDVDVIVEISFSY